ncbi:hypothetical protein PN836_015905 [Ningiella sp. W23]|uniref:hypothetical protein n=1 Tax=Ningiella sp. W23 TaxID=3023715 RepID=UPI0037562DF1
MKKTIALVICMFMANANAALLTDPAGLVGTQSLIDFSQFTGTNQKEGVGTAEQIGDLVGEDIQAQSIGSSELWLYDVSWGLSTNGDWNSDRNGWLGIFPGEGPVRIDFNTADISGFGFFMNIVPEFGTVSLSAFDSSGTLLEFFDITATANISTPDAINGGAFRGIQLATTNIAYIELVGDTAVFDDLRFVRSTINASAPTSFVLIALAIVGIAFSSVKRRK